MGGSSTLWSLPPISHFLLLSCIPTLVPVEKAITSMELQQVQSCFLCIPCSEGCENCIMNCAKAMKMNVICSLFREYSIFSTGFVTLQHLHKLLIKELRQITLTVSTVTCHSYFLLVVSAYSLEFTHYEYLWNYKNIPCILGLSHKVYMQCQTYPKSEGYSDLSFWFRWIFKMSVSISFPLLRT